MAILEENQALKKEESQPPANEPSPRSKASASFYDDPTQSPIQI